MSLFPARVVNVFLGSGELGGLGAVPLRSGSLRVFFAAVVVVVVAEPYEERDHRLSASAGRVVERFAPAFSGDKCEGEGEMGEAGSSSTNRGTRTTSCGWPREVDAAKGTGSSAVVIGMRWWSEAEGEEALSARGSGGYATETGSSASFLSTCARNQKRIRQYSISSS